MLQEIFIVSGDNKRAKYIFNSNYSLVLQQLLALSFLKNINTKCLKVVTIQTPQLSKISQSNPKDLLERLLSQTNFLMLGYYTFFVNLNDFHAIKKCVMHKSKTDFITLISSLYYL